MVIDHLDAVFLDDHHTRLVITLPEFVRSHNNPNQPAGWKATDIPISHGETCDVFINGKDDLFRYFGTYKCRILQTLTFDDLRRVPGFMVRLFLYEKPPSHTS